MTTLRLLATTLGMLILVGCDNWEEQGFASKEEAEQIRERGYETYESYAKGEGFTNVEEARRISALGFDTRPKFEEHLRSRADDVIKTLYVDGAFAYSPTACEENYGVRDELARENVDTSMFEQVLASCTSTAAQIRLEEAKKKGFSDVESMEAASEVGIDSGKEYATYLAKLEKRRKLEALAKKYPYTAEISCKLGGRWAQLIHCYAESRSEIQITNNGRKNIYKNYQLGKIPNSRWIGKYSDETLEIDLSRSFTIKTQNLSEWE